MEADTKHVSFLRHALIYGIGAMAAPLSSFVVVPLYTHYLAPADYGSLQLIYRIGGVFHICLMIGGIRLAAFYLFGKHDDARGRQHAAASITAFTFLALIAGAALTVALGGWLNDLMSFGNAQLLILGVLTLKARALTVMPLAMMQARFESVAFIAINFGIAVVHVALVTLTLAVLGWGVWGVLAAVAVTHGLFGLCLTARELMRAAWRPDLGQIREIASFAMPFIPAGLCFFVMHNGDHFFLMKYRGAAVLGVYALGYQFVQVLEMVGTAPLRQVWQPWMYRIYHQPGGPRILGQAATRIVGVYVFLAAGLVIFRHEVLGLMGTPAYASAAVVMPVLALAYFHMTLADLADASLFVTRKTYLKPVVAVVSAGVILACYAILIPAYGAVGAAYATWVGFAFHLGLTLVVAQRVFRIAYEPRRLAMLLLTAIALAAAAHWLGVGWLAALAKLGMWLAWPLLLWAGGFFSPEEKGYVRRWLKTAIAWRPRARGSRLASETP